MNRKTSELVAAAAALVMMLGFAAAASAQVFTGRIDVIVEDSTAGRVPNAPVDIAGPVNQRQTTDTEGRAHFVDLPSGPYVLKANLAGFRGYTNADVEVAAGASTRAVVTLVGAGTNEAGRGAAVAPAVDPARDTTTHVSMEELQNIPSAHDPWTVLQTIPGIYLDRVNVGGSDAGRQSTFIGKGAQPADNTWNLDGIPITDMASTGSSPTFYDPDMFQEMAVTTGGAGVTGQTPGVQVNLVLKKGDETPHGDGTVYFANQNLQSSNLPSDLAATLGGVTGTGSGIDRYFEDGFDLGGPILQDQIWGWGSMRRTHVQLLMPSGAPDETFLTNYAFKADWKPYDAIRAAFTLFDANDVQNGESASSVRPAETTWNRTGPTKIYKGDGNFIVGRNLFASVRAAYITSSFVLNPVGGLTPSVYVDDTGVYHGSYELRTGDRPQYYAGGDGSYFLGNHEIKFGFSWRKTPVDSLNQWPGSRIVTFANGYPNLQAQVTQDFVASTTGRYANAFIADTISLNRLTVIAGLRLDHQTSSLNASATPAVPGFENILPAKTAAAVADAYDFNTLAPRVGITYAVDESRKTVARASYALYASQLPATAANFVSPAQYSYAIYSAVDKNANNVVDPNEIGTLVGTRGFNPANPGAVSTANTIGNISAPRTQEFLAGIDREIAPEFGVGATMTYRYFDRFLWNPPLGATSADYAQTGVFTGILANAGTVSVPYYGLSEAVAAANGFGYTAQNRPDYHQRYLGIELSATKRLGNRWMGRFAFSTQSWKEYFDASDAIMDPTPTPSTSGEFANLTSSGPNVNGGPVVVASAGTGASAVYLVAPKYTISANGLYQGPWGLDLGANLAARPGYGELWQRTRLATGDALVPDKTLLIAPGADAGRLPAVIELDGRLERIFKFGSSKLALDFDVFNLLNRATTLGLQYDARSVDYGQILEIQNPRIARLGVRFTF